MKTNVMIYIKKCKNQYEIDFLDFSRIEKNGYLQQIMDISTFTFLGSFAT